jgi:predicted PurR-regulated permease PerM
MTDSRPGQGRIREVMPPEDRADESAGPERRDILATGLAILAACISIFLVWQTASSLLIIFAGVLFAAFLDAAARAIAPIFPVNRAWRLTLVVLLLSALLGFGMVWGPARYPSKYTCCCK